MSFWDLLTKGLGGGTTDENGLRIILPDEIKNFEFDQIIVATDDGSVSGTLTRDYFVSKDLINTNRYLNSIAWNVRIRAMEHVAELCHQYHITGSTAEVGVFQGDFAKHINRVFADRKLYLYDTFEGFSDKDLEKENKDAAMRSYKHYSATSQELVLKKMPNPDNVVICRGIFPETARGENEKYCFVNLDADLYMPTIEGLKFFYPRMSNGGVIFINYYFNTCFPGVRQAVEEFSKMEEIAINPLGDYLTVSIGRPMCGM